MKIKANYTATLFLMLLAFAVPSLMAQEAKKQELPKSGDLSRTISGVSDSRALPEPWGGVDVAGSTASPISGSVSKSTGDRWVMRLFNNSEDSYSVDVAVEQFDRGGSKVKGDSFSYRLKAKQSVERSIPSSPTTEQASLKLVSWRKFASKIETPKAESPAAQQ